MNPIALKPIIDYWKNNYDWRKREKFLNKYPQYTTVIQGLNIHFIHVKPKNAKNLEVKPLLLLHGWPGSIREFYKVIPILTERKKDRNFVFEVVVPSLPGFGFSQAATKPGLGPVEISIIMKNLMLKLGFEKFYVQGGDWGSAIAKSMSVLFPQHILGLHTNLCHSFRPMAILKLLIGSLYPSLFIEKKYENKMYPLSTKWKEFLASSGYFHIQATTPDTLGAALSDSPIGLAAYILEKFSLGTDRNNKKKLDAGLLEKFTFDELLDNVMIYWVSDSITTSMRLYLEYVNSQHDASVVYR